MYITSISLSYIFLSIGLISLAFFGYFKFIVTKSSDKKNYKKVVGKIKSPETWKNKNNKMAYISLFWCILSIALFAYFKFMYTANLLSLSYLFIYIAIITATMFIVILQRNTSK